MKKGEVNVSKFNLYEKLGENGGFGDVFRARKIIDEKEIEEDFAIKILKVDSEDAKNRFNREVRILRTLDNPRIMRVIEFNLNIDKPLYVMPRYNSSLRAYLPEIKDDYKRIRTIFNAIFDGIEYLHNGGIYHRDIKPENFLMNSDTDIVISDLGLGVDITSESTRLTKTGMFMGTLVYMSPEQIKDSKHVDNRTDIYSLGKVLYECFTGSVDITVDLSLLPKGVKYVISKCLNTNINDRFLNVAELRAAFNSSLDIILYGVQKNDINDIINELVINSNYQDNVEALVNILNEMDYEKEEDTIHEIVMKLPVNTLIDMQNRNKYVFNDIIKAFVDNVVKTGWSFEYTDKIGSKCKEIFNATEELESKALLIYCVIEVGYAHNRWYVDGCAKDMIYSIDDTDLAFIVKDKIKKNIDNYAINRLNIEISKVHPIMQECLKTELELV